MENSLGYIDLMVYGETVQALVDMDVAHSFMTTRLAKETGLTSIMEVEAADSRAKVFGLVHDVPIQIKEWGGQLDFIVMNLDDFDMILGRDFLRGSKAVVVPFHDEGVSSSTTMKDELEDDQVDPGSCSLSTYMDEITHMKEPHDDEVSDDTCVSFGNLVDGLCAVKGRTSLPMLWRILPWMTMMEPCMEKQGSLVAAGLVGATCDLMVEGAKARDKGGT